MAGTNSRMLRREALADSRLLTVSRDARMLGLLLDNVAEDTGVLPNDPMALRVALGMFLMSDDGMPPSQAVMSAWIDELVDSRYLLRYEGDGAPLLYLQGFGERQKGVNVALGYSVTTGEVEKHLPLPPCVELISRTDERKRYPKHCARPHDACPTCASFRKPSGTSLEGSMEERAGEGMEKASERERSEKRGVGGNASTEGTTKPVFVHTETVAEGSPWNRSHDTEASA